MNESQLAQLGRIAESLDLSRVRDDAVAAASRLAEGQFYVACIGQFKRGKSTLIDALLHDPVLPAGILPVTAVPTIVRYGEQRSARVRMMRHTTSAASTPNWMPIAPSELQRYVSEEDNPGNELGVLAVEVFVPSPLLREGMCLVDTPGVGSVFDANTAATRAFVPHIDAALIVVGADPPISGEELDLIGEVAGHVEHLLVVLNKADRVNDEERRVASDFARTVISRRLRRPIDIVYQVSATERLSGIGPSRDWDRLVAALESFAETSGHHLVQRAAERATDRIAELLRAVSRERRAALLRPTEENQRRIDELEVILSDGERALLDLSALFGAEQQRLSRRFSVDRADFLRDAAPRAQRALRKSAQSIASRFGPSRRRALMRATQHVAREILEPWLSAEQEVAEAAYNDSMTRFADRTNAFLDRLADSGLPELESRGALDDAVGFTERSRFVFNEVITVAAPASPLRLAADIVLGAVAPAVIERDAVRFLDWLLEMNSSRVASDVEQRMAASQRVLEGQVRGLLRDGAARAQQALASANAAQAAGADAIESELGRLDEINAELQGIVFY
jgi:predicted GTPase